MFDFDNQGGEQIGDISIVDNGMPLGWFDPDSEIHLNEYDRQRILDLADIIRQSSSLVPALSSNLPVRSSNISHQLTQNADPGQFSLEDTYLAFDLRESYLQRKSNLFGNQAESTILETDEFETKTCNLWRANDS